MYKFTDLLATLPRFRQTRLVHNSYGLWIMWEDRAQESVFNILRDFGGIPLAEEKNQTLWVFLTNNIFNALARVHLLLSLESEKMTYVVIPGNFLVSRELEISMSFPMQIKQFEFSEQIGKHHILINSACNDTVNAFPGLSCSRSQVFDGMPSSWSEFKADTGLEYASNQRWYVFLRPLGHMSDKDSVHQWRDYWQLIQKVIKEVGCTFLYDEKHWIVLINISNIVQLRALCQNILKQISYYIPEKDIHWPLAFACMPQRGLPFHVSILDRINFRWENFIPDVFYLHYKDAFLLREEFRLTAGFGNHELESISSWCQVALTEEGGNQAEHLNVILPETLYLTGGNFCFYCGLQTHSAANCPSRQLAFPTNKYRDKLHSISTETLMESINNLRSYLEDKNIEMAYADLLESNNMDSTIIKYLLECTSAHQLRMFEFVAASNAKSWPQIFETPTDHGAGLNTLGKYYKNFINGENAAIAEELKSLTNSRAQNPDPFCVVGFMAVEEVDFTKATRYFDEACKRSVAPATVSYVLFLQARVLEIENDFRHAISFYKRISSLNPDWLEPQYRIAVCFVKLGFAFQAIDMFKHIVRNNAYFFTRLLLDPEIERGRTSIFDFLGEEWNNISLSADAIEIEIDTFRTYIKETFEEESAFYIFAIGDIDRIMQLYVLHNYLSLREVIGSFANLKQETELCVAKEVKRIRRNIGIYLEALHEVRKEAAWFPFPRMLLEFNSQFNQCVESLKWIGDNPIMKQGNHLGAQQHSRKIEENIRKLRRSLITLKIVRDASLFGVLLGKRFIIYEVFFLLLALIGLPLAMYFVGDIFGDKVSSYIKDNQWEFQKGLVIILSVLALILSALGSTLSFERVKEKLFKEPDEEDNK